MDFALDRLIVIRNPTLIPFDLHQNFNFSLKFGIASSLVNTVSIFLVVFNY